MRTSLIVLLLLISSVAAADELTVAAALPDQAAECRYLLDLCQNHSGSTSGSILTAKVARVIRSKHETMPECFHECRDAMGPVLDLEKFQ